MHERHGFKSPSSIVGSDTSKRFRIRVVQRYDVYEVPVAPKESLRKTSYGCYVPFMVEDVVVVFRKGIYKGMA